MTNTIKISRGVKANMPVLANGQQYFCTDTKELYVGNNGTNENLSGGTEVVYQISATYVELTALVAASTLKPGMKYLLTDYQTKYKQPRTNVIKTVDTIERLVLTAISPTQFDRRCSSLDFPQDIITYDFNNNLCEDGITPRNGFILRRHDTIKNINCPHDWRTILWARFKVDASKYPVWASGVSVTQGTIYVAGINIVKSTGTGIPINSKDENYFGCVLVSDYQNKYADGSIVNVDLANVKEVLTFQDLSSLVYNIFIDDYLVENKLTLTDNTFDINCNNNKLGTNCYGNTFGSNCENNTIGSGCYNNTFGNGFRYNTIGNTSYLNSFESMCKSNDIGDNFISNLIGKTFMYNTVESFCKYMVCGEYFNYNSIGTSTSSNMFGSQCTYNSIGSGCMLTIFGGNCIYVSCETYSPISKNLSAIPDMRGSFHKTIMRGGAGNKFIYMKVGESNVAVYTLLP